MNTITLFLKDGQVFRHQEEKTIPQLQIKYAIGNTLNGGNLIIEATTIE